MAITKRLVEKTYDALTIDEAKQTEAINVAEGESIAFMVVASDESSISGASIQIQGSLDGTNFLPWRVQ